MRTEICTEYNQAMDTVSYTDLRKKLATFLDQVNEDRAPLLITRQKGDSAVLMSLDDFESIQATLYLMQSPRNAERLQEAIDGLRAGSGEGRELIE